MKSRLILLVVVIALIAGFGALLHSPPSIIDAVTGATPKAKKAAQSSAQLEGSYIFCMNPLLDKLSDEDIREQLKAFVTGKTDSIRTDTELSFDIYVSETDYALIRYADSLCERLNDAGADVQIKQYSGIMLRSRAVSGKYEAFLLSLIHISEPTRPRLISYAVFCLKKKKRKKKRKKKKTFFFFFFNDTATTEIYTLSVVGSVRCV